MLSASTFITIFKYGTAAPAFVQRTLFSIERLEIFFRSNIFETPVIICNGMKTSQWQIKCFPLKFRKALQNLLLCKMVVFTISLTISVIEMNLFQIFHVVMPKNYSPKASQFFVLHFLFPAKKNMSLAPLPVMQWGIQVTFEKVKEVTNIIV